MPRKKTRREERRKNRSEKKAKPSTPIQATDASMGEEEQNRKQKEEGGSIDRRNVDRSTGERVNIQL